jgi:tetratricopeptide (TPR) repeat protein
MARLTDKIAVQSISRRAILKGLAMAPVLFRAAPFLGAPRRSGTFPVPGSDSSLPFADIRFVPHYPARSPLADLMGLVAPGSDEYGLEKYAVEIESVLRAWARQLRETSRIFSSIGASLDPAILASTLKPSDEKTIRSAHGIDVVRRKFASELVPGRDSCMRAFSTWLEPVEKIETAEFEIYAIDQVSKSPLAVHVELRYNLVAGRKDRRREERVGSWRMEWVQDATGNWLARQWEAGEETVCTAIGPVFIDVTSIALGAIDSYRKQMLRGADHWRTVLDGAVGVDVYCNNGVSAGDYDNDGFDDLYVCQPAGLPNRLYRNRGDGSFEDVTEKAGVGVLDNTACALFADFDNRGLQDLLVVCGTGPLLFINRGDGTFALKRDAFQFSHPAQGTFTHAAVADYDRDGRLDIYFCTYMYYLGLDQYHYPIPYYDARNGPPNCLFHNQGGGRFVETTEASGMNADNDRYSFACAWGDSASDGLPDLFVANDFGSSQLYRNNGDGTFKVVSHEANVESVGAGMSCCWCDYDNDGRQDIYVPSMWEAAGQRVSAQSQFHKDSPAKIRELYQRHARGNALYRNQGNGRFENVGQHARVEMGRWSWSSDFWDFDHDGMSDLYVANGYISGPEQNDLASFFWRQVVAKSSDDATASLAYEQGWNAINELVRSDNTWHGFARNVLFLNCGDGSFAEASGAVGLDCIEDSRSFALADLDHDGRLEVIVKNRNAPQIRLLHNAMKDIGQSVSFRLRGHKSNRDGIGAAIMVEANGNRQTKYLQSGSGFLAQHTRELFFGVGNAAGNIHAEILWPSGLSQSFDRLPANQRITLEEGLSTFQSVPFASTAKIFQGSALDPVLEPLPRDVETWLIQPLKAPGFSLPDLSGTVRELTSWLGLPVLLAFWSHQSSLSVDMLHKLQENRARIAASQLQILAINVDNEAGTTEARAIASRGHFDFLVLFATPEIAGIYNLIYRYLFERRRDLAIPAAFLLDREGTIVKVYQGAIDPERAAADAKSIPTTAAERTRRALPFPGLLIQDAFSRNDFTYGAAMFQHGYLEQAAESFKQVIAVKPDNADAYYNLGTLSLRRKDLKQAREYLEQTVKLRADYPEAWNNLGMLAAQENNYDEAVDRFKRSLAQRPNYAVALLNLGNVYRKQKAYDQAKECLTRALSLLPDDPEINYSIGMLDAQLNQMEPAASYLKRALDLRPDYPEASNNLGIVFVRQQDYLKAEEQFKAGIRLSPEFDQSYLNLARLYAIENDKERARQVLHNLLQVQPENPTAKQALEMLH